MEKPSKVPHPSLPGPVLPPHRPFGELQVVNNLLNRVATGEPPGNRNRSRRCYTSGVYLSSCAYRVHWSYARNLPTSRARLYEFVWCAAIRYLLST